MKVLKQFIILIVIISYFSNFLVGQPFNKSFSPLESKGEIPSEFKDLINKKTKTADFNLLLKEMFLKGEIIYGTSMNQYINTIADNLLKDYPSLRNELRFYIINSPIVNAVASDNGIVLINVGMIAQISNESELAFIISHEIIHYVEHHVIEMTSYEEALKKNESKDSYLKYHNRSRENEFEADKLGFERYYKNSPYSYAALENVFDVLQYSKLPFDEIPFQRMYVETNFYHFPNDYYLSAVTPIRTRDDYVDTLSTHPNIQKRRAVIQQLISGLSNDGKQLFIQPEELFYQIRDFARFQCIHLYLIQHEYDNAFYNTFILKQTYTNNNYLALAKAAAMYGLYKYKDEGQFSEVIENYKKIEGEIQQVNFFFSKLNKKEIALLALRFAWEAYNKDNENQYLLKISKDLIKEISIDNKMGYIDFSDYPMGTILDTIANEPGKTDTIITTNKYDRIKKQSVKGGKVKPSDKFQTLNYMLVDLRTDKKFMEVWESVVKAEEDQEINNIVKDNTIIDVKKILINKPYYYIISNKNNTKAFLKNYAKGEKESEQLSKIIQTSVDKLHLDNTFYSTDNIKNFNTDEYNKYAAIQLWIQDYLSSDDVKMINYQSNYLSDIMNETGCNALNLILVGQTNSYFINGHKLLSLLGTILCPVISPVTISTFVLPRNQVYIQFEVVDFETGEKIFYKTMEAQSASTEAYINAFIYNMYAKIKKNKKS